MDALRRTLRPYGATRAERASMARGLAMLYGSGAALVFLTVLLPHGRDFWAPGVAGPGALAVIVATALARAGGRTPVPVLHAVLAMGTVLIGVCTASGGESATAYPLLFLWVAMYAAFFFPPLHVAGHGVLAAVVLVTVLVVTEGVRTPVSHGLMAIGTVGVLAVLLSRLVAFLREQAADLAFVAGAATREGDLGHAVCEGLRASARGDAAALLEPSGDGFAITSRSGGTHAETVLMGAAGRAAVASALAGARAVVVEAPGARRRASALVQPVLRDGRPVAVLAVAWAAPRRGPDDRVRQAALLFAAQASVALERAEQATRERERRALEINDQIVQGLVVARMAVRAGHAEEAVRALDETLARARKLITDQLAGVAGGETISPADLVRRGAAKV